MRKARVTRDLPIKSYDGAVVIVAGTVVEIQEELLTICIVRLAFGQRYGLPTTALEPIDDGC